MKTFPRLLARIAVAAAVWLVIACLPVIPVLKAPVVLDAVYESAFVSILQLFAGRYLMGISIRATWLTFPILIGLVAAAVFAARYLNRRIFNRANTAA